MKIYTCMLVDDETLARELLTAYIHKIPNLHIVASCSNAIEAKSALEKYQPDLLFLDIQMPDLTGIELLRMLKKQPAVILTTAYSEYALEGYQLAVTDYLLKPIEFDRFFQAVSKAVDWLGHGSVYNQPVAVSLPGKEHGNYFFVKADSRIIKVEFGDILFVEALQKYVCIHTTTTRIITLLSMSQLGISLPQAQFCRVHRSYIVNLHKIDSIEGNMIHIGKHDLPISKGQRDAFLEIVKNKGLGW